MPIGTSFLHQLAVVIIACGFYYLLSANPLFWRVNTLLSDKNNRILLELRFYCRGLRKFASYFPADRPYRKKLHISDFYVCRRVKASPYLPLQSSKESRLKNSSCRVRMTRRAHPCSFNFWTTWPIFIKPGTDGLKMGAILACSWIFCTKCCIRQEGHLNISST